MTWSAWREIVWALGSNHIKFKAVQIPATDLFAYVRDSCYFAPRPTLFTRLRYLLCYNSIISSRFIEFITTEMFRFIEFLKKSRFIDIIIISLALLAFQLNCLPICGIHLALKYVSEFRQILFQSFNDKLVGHKGFISTWYFNVWSPSWTTVLVTGVPHLHLLIVIVVFS